MVILSRISYQIHYDIANIFLVEFKFNSFVNKIKCFLFGIIPRKVIIIRDFRTATKMSFIDNIATSKAEPDRNIVHNSLLNKINSK